jgi:hypothetical protein
MRFTSDESSKALSFSVQLANLVVEGRGTIDQDAPDTCHDRQPARYRALPQDVHRTCFGANARTRIPGTIKRGSSTIPITVASFPRF